MRQHQEQGRKEKGHKTTRKPTRWMCRECCRVVEARYDKCWSCGKPRSEVEAKEG